MEGGHLVGVFHLREEERDEAVEMIVIMIGSEGTIQGEIGIGNGGGDLLNAVQGGMGGTKMRYDYSYWCGIAFSVFVAFRVLIAVLYASHI